MSHTVDSLLALYHHEETCDGITTIVTEDSNDRGLFHVTVDAEGADWAKGLTLWTSERGLDKARFAALTMTHRFADVAKRIQYKEQNGLTVGTFECSTGDMYECANVDRHQVTADLINTIHHFGE